MKNTFQIETVPVKFMAWHNENKSMHIVDEISWDVDGQIHGLLRNNNDGRCWFLNDEFISLKISNKITDAGGIILRQFTGHYDKNGKEIYEGDILNIYPVNKPREHYGDVSIFFIEKYIDSWGFTFNWNSISGYECSTHIMKNEEEQGGVNYEIIGNIYENPEILKTKKKDILLLESVK